MQMCYVITKRKQKFLSLQFSCLVFFLCNGKYTISFLLNFGKLMVTFAQKEIIIIIY